jgi:hypothetical protein
MEILTLFAFFGKTSKGFLYLWTYVSPHFVIFSKMGTPSSIHGLLLKEAWFKSQQIAPSRREVSLEKTACAVNRFSA